jgi:large subunit ribosomal protein L3
MSQKMGLLGRKLGMTRVFHDDGTSLGCTALEVGPCVVTAQRTPEKHGYVALQLGFEQRSPRHLRRSEAKLFEKLKIERTPAVLREVRLELNDAATKFEVGKVLKADEVFKSGDVVDVVGVSKGKGYQGVMKKHHMAGSVNGHGSHEFFRHGGSIGCRLTPGRVHKGKRMPGHMGHVRCTASDLVVVKVFPEQNVVLVKGAVPGPAHGLVFLKGSAKNVKKYIVPVVQVEAESKNPMKASKKGQTTK